MHVRSRLILAALAATMLLAIVVSSSATARNLSASGGRFELVWNRPRNSIKTNLEFIDRNNGVNVQCHVTLFGNFSEHTIRKETARTQGVVNRGELESCTNGTATIRTETMPWAVRYGSFSGTLPRIRSLGLALIGATFRIREANGVECEAGTEANHPGVFIFGSSTEILENGFELTGQPEFVTAERGSRIPLGGGFLCSFAGEGEIGGLGLVLEEPFRLLGITLI